ncbi:phosphoadenosine phosphosulfate reductase family protein [Pseudomonas putida]|uniref:phosphoadenosine phosphosulfate reductase domain-containing protein n=1 Tax=Pseudomonas putida TaxID=303 RepID=UPI002B250BB3|nr:phosphoadenosine phosphosulfate reductase family protein [Pseudomonas putida]
MSTAQILLNQSIQAGLFEELVPVAGLAPVKEKTFEDKVHDAIAAIKQQVIDGRHLVVAWSGGKDSSVTLNLAFTALRELKADGIEIPTLHAIHSRTGIDNPVVELYNKGQIKSIEAYGEASGIPTRVWVASPNLSNDYLVSLLAGRTIMSVGGNSRCQQMMKAAPLTRIKRQVRAFIAQTTGVKPKDAELVSLIGTRFDESIARAAKMKERGENATEAVDAMDDGQLVLSPIADWNTFDIFTYIGWVRSDKIEAYNRFDELVDIYRDANGGDCMVNAYIAGKEQSRPPCSSRTGCSLCGRISRDTSASNMVATDGGKYGWMAPLLELRSYMLARHFDPSARCWLARTLNEVTGSVNICPNAYSPAYCEDLLRIILTIQIREEIAAGRLGIAPRFTLLDERQLIAIDIISARYGYQHTFVALRTYKEIYEGGKRYDIPDLGSIPKYTEKDVAFRAEVPFADAEYHSAWRGFRNISHAMVDWESTTTLADGTIVQSANTGNEFEIDEEGAALFMAFELDYALERINLLDNPMAVVDYFVGLGTVTLYKGSLGEWDRMARMSNQIFAHGIKDILHDPQALVETLRAKFNVEPEVEPANQDHLAKEETLGQLAFWL